MNKEDKLENEVWRAYIKVKKYTGNAAPATFNVLAVVTECPFDGLLAQAWESGYWGEGWENGNFDVEVLTAYAMYLRECIKELERE